MTGLSIFSKESVIRKCISNGQKTEKLFGSFSSRRITLFLPYNCFSSALVKEVLNVEYCMMYLIVWFAGKDIEKELRQRHRASNLAYSTLGPVLYWLIPYIILNYGSAFRQPINYGTYRKFLCPLKINMLSNTVFWIRIRIGLDPHHFARSGSGSASSACRSRSGRSGSVSFPSKRKNLSSRLFTGKFQYAIRDDWEER